MRLSVCMNITVFSPSVFNFVWFFYITHHLEVSQCSISTLRRQISSTAHRKTSVNPHSEASRRDKVSGVAPFFISFLPSTSCLPGVCLSVCLSLSFSLSLPSQWMTQPICLPPLPPLHPLSRLGPWHKVHPHTLF